jgi:fructoselysine 3-epimerase
MKFSVASSVFVNYAIEDTVRLIAEAGYQGVDIWGGRPHVYRRDLNPQRLEALSNLVERLGLSVPSFMPAFFRYPHSLSNPNPVIRKDSLDYMRMCIENAAVLKARAILIVPGRSLHGQTHEDAWGRLVESTRTVCEMARPYGLTPVVEPVNRWVSDLVNTAADADRLIQQADCDNLGITLDTGHVHLSEERFPDAVRIAGGRLYQIHVNDNDGQSQQNLVLGEGTFDFDAFKAILSDLDYQGFLTNELGWEYTLDPDQAVKVAMAQMRKIFL